MSDIDATFRGWWELVERRATLTPDGVYLVDRHDRTITFGAFRDAAERVAAGLAARGVGRGTVVSWQLPTTIEAAVLMSALARLDAIQNPIIAIFRDAEVDFIVGQLHTQLLIVPDVWRGYDHAALAERVAAHHGCDVLVCPAELYDQDLSITLGAGVPDAPGRADAAPLTGPALPLGDPATLPPPPTVPTEREPTEREPTEREPTEREPTEREPTEGEPAERAPGPVRWVLYSSGTTGTPKGVRHTDASVIAGSHAMTTQLVFDESDVASIAFPIAHIGAVGLLSLGLRSGCRVVLIDAWDPARSPFDLGRHGVTMLGSSAVFFHAYLRAQKAHGAEPLFPRLRFGMYGGAPNEPGLHERVRDELGGEGILNGWGLTEFPMAGYPPPGSPEEKLRTTAGRPGPGVRVRVVGLDGVDVPRGQEGELRLAGPQLFAGYVDPALDVDGIDEQGYLRTGDLGSYDEEGWLYITGRIKDIIVRNGENISALEVENVLTGHPAIEEVAVAGLPDPRTGERTVAFAVLAEGTTLALPDLVAYCHEHGLAPFKIPEQLEIVQSLPRNAMGKVIKKQLQDTVRPLAARP